MTKVTLIEGGPAVLQSESEITVDDKLMGNKVALCRCGKSANGSFCDGSHRETNG